MRKRVTFESSSDDSETGEHVPPSQVKKKLVLYSIGQKLLSLDGDQELHNPDYTLMNIESSDESESEQSERKDQVKSSQFDAFSDRSIGFQMMKRMGFSKGETLGVRGGIKEPLIPVARTRRLGLGATRRGDMEVFDVDNNCSVEAYHQQRKGNLARSRNMRTVERLQKFCFEESGDSARPRDQVNVMWRLLAAPEPHGQNEAPKEGQSEAQTAAGAQEATSEEIWDQKDLVAKLEALVQYSRLAFLYCIYCSIRYSSAEDMASCPGLREEDHVL